MKIIEQNVVGKEGNPELCEDALAITDRYIAVIDGATAKGAFLINGQSPGRAIAQALRAFLVEYNSDSSGVDLIQIMTDYVNSTLVRPSGDRAVNENTPSASIAVYTRHHKRITIIGDIQFLINGSGRLKRKKIDQLLGSARALYLRMLLAKGIGVDHFETDDPGREVILPLLRMQYLLRNNKAFDEWAYGDIDGHSFDPTFVDSIAVNDGDEIVLCSDGYPALLPTLEKAELALQQVLKTDPLRVRQPDTKGIRKGNLSYDDRTYIRFLA